MSSHLKGRNTNEIPTTTLTLCQLQQLAHTTSCVLGSNL